MSINEPQYFSIRDLFSKDDYVIPIYQRAYAWTTKQIVQLVQDIADSCTECKNKNEEKKYYIGTLITFIEKRDEKEVYQVIDGQQRLTTLTLLLDFLKTINIEMDWYSKQRLHFDCRKSSTETLDLLYDGEVNSINNIKLNVTIKDGYEDIKKCFPKICKENNISETEFCNYLFNKVTILRVLVPEDTDLNHYFEIMNSRGEQLEKHEILKAKCLEKIKSPQDKYAFALIWDSCSNMERYIQYGFTVGQRNLLFGTRENNKWNDIPENKEKVYEILKDELKDNKQINSFENTNEKSWASLEEIIKQAPNKEQNSEKNNDANDSFRFNTIINFSNFLLHILKIQVGTDIPLDDKRLIDSFNEQFEKYTDQNECENFVKEFGYRLLKGKLLYDKFVIKREFISGIDRWSLKKLTINNDSQSYSPTFANENEDENRQIIMLLSMFHVSTPTLVYKHWLNGVLMWLFDHPEPSFQEYKNYLEDLAKAIFFDHYLSKNPLDYYSILYLNKGKSKISKNDEVDRLILDQGVKVENYIFNYLDYLLWKDYVLGTRKYFPSFFKDDIRVKNFEYTFRSSVEHYFPQHPMDDIGDDKEEIKKYIDNFGNLCLISSSKNSRLSNYMPLAKKEHYESSPTIDSIKQCIMMSYEEWDTSGKNGDNEILIHAEEMKKCLFDSLV